MYIFCYGSNGPKQLSDRVVADYNDILRRTYPVIAKGWLRGFKSKSRNWKGCSTATIFQTGKEEDTVYGTAVRLTKAEIQKLDPFEGYPYKYGRFPVKVTAFTVSEGTTMPP